MAKLLKLRRGTTTQHGSFTGAEGEVTIDTTKDTAVVHDGSTAGGRPLARQDMNNVPAGTILGTQLENSGVSAGQYGSSSAIPIVTVDAQGLVTAASTTAIDSTTIANGTSNVAVANNGNITATRSGTARLVVDNEGVDVTGKLTTTDNITITSTAPKIFLVDSDTNDDFSINGDGGTFRIKSETDGANRFVVNSDGHVDIPGNLDVGAGIDVTGSVIATGNGNSFGDTTIASLAPTLNFDDGNSTPDYRIINNSGSFEFQDKTNSYAARIKINSDGHVDIPGNLDAEGGIDVTGDISVTGTVDGINIAVRDTLFGHLTTNNGVLKNGVSATTKAQSDNSTAVATTAYVRTAISEAQAFPSGTVMLFAQSSAPTGWTKSTSHNNKALRVVSGTASSGGNQTFNTIFASRNLTANAGNTTATGNISVANTTAGGNVTIANASTGGTVNSHTLTTSQMPAHSHNQQVVGGSNSNQYPVRVTAGRQPNWTNVSTHDTGGGGGHSHGFTGGSHNHNGTLSGTAHNHNASFSGSAHNHSISVTNLDMQVQYVDVILATKD